MCNASAWLWRVFQVGLKVSEEAPALNKDGIIYGVNCSMNKWDGGSTQSVSLFTVMASTAVGTC